MSKTTISSMGVIETVYQQLRVRLVTGQLRPGLRLKISLIADDIQVSTGVVREALTRLSAENLVIATPQRGFSVAPMSAAELMDITRTRIDIEGLCIRRSLIAGDIEWESAVVGAYHRLMHTPARDGHRQALPSAAWYSAHNHFHDTIVSACDSPWLLKLREQLHVQGERYRLISASMIHHDERDLDHEHEQLLNAVTSRDADLTVNLIGSHFFSTAQGLLERGAELWLDNQA
ncbi:GntR family transcriptional regulator [Pseudomonas sp. 21LCFQ02]|uniref:GntR family transcriptional regulator n=1 Tax=Pseudomonas sp. 21LCFQ02 TaxID=2957505 RepID=UPI00209B8057|nr:GntR family transcriptional regulator [Pseudomonas sp. 21LCFQ02]MCO8167507.1 GntR family transcriptional regulator [Pseudomonas sp. 21LCFQ02]